MKYYKNNCIAFFVPAAITALAILVRDAFQFSASDLHSDYEFLQYFFKYEYYKNAISNYFNLRYLREISRNQFEDLINQIDEKAFAKDHIDTILKTIKTGSPKTGT